MKKPNRLIPSLPTTDRLTVAYVLSLIVAGLMGAASLTGLLIPDTLYPTAELQQTLIPNDFVNLLIGLPTLFGSIWFTRRGSLLALLLWPGALLYNFYNYLVYVFGMPFTWLSSLYAIIVLLSGFGAFDLLRRIDPKTVQARLANVAPVKTAGWVMLVFGVLFIFRAIGVVVAPLTSGTALPLSEIGLAVADVTLSILWIVCGGLLLRRKPWGYLSGLGLLFTASMLFIGLIVFLLVQPLLTDAAFALVDLAVVAAMGLVCFIPFGLFVRAVVSIEAR